VTASSGQLVYMFQFVDFLLIVSLLAGFVGLLQRAATLNILDFNILASYVATHQTALIVP
jgi:positive regulator of sigma E activity